MNAILQIFHYAYMVVGIGCIFYILITLGAKTIISKTKESKGKETNS